MGRKIIVAGGGHGGIATAMLLAQNGFDVEVYEQNAQDNMGYDWTDIFNPRAFGKIGLPLPPEEMYEYKTDMTFYSVSENTAIEQRVPESEKEIKMERRDIYKYIISHAEKAGVKFNYGYTITGAIVQGKTVVGIRTDKGDVLGDLVIDSCGCDSALRASLPEDFGIQAKVNEYEKFFIYRAFFNRVSQEPVKDPFKVCVFAEGKLGIGWVATEENHTDLLVGRFEQFDMEEATRTADYYRSRNASLGTQVLRGNYFASIPVRHPLSIMVANGYAAIGDSAFMTFPITGTGIANCFSAAPMLATVLIKNKDKDYTADVLWEYQREYYKKIGNGLAPVAKAKLFLTTVTPEELDYIFDNKIISSKELSVSAEKVDIDIASYFNKETLLRGKAVLSNKALMKKFMTLAKGMLKVVAATSTMPKEYDEHKVSEWARKYDSLFTVD
ncbi:MAG: NAD(P)/FAD-dependent oxidoreductase [Clostridia bacterium]|nr:NAD(P)/FAD-dependent oxidoreductase [Clostridia bacterium]